MSFFDDASLVFLPSGEAGKDGKAYSMKPTNGNGDFTFSRGSNLTATRVDSNGLIEKGRENLFLNSDTPATQSITITNGGVYVLSFLGTGSVVASGGASFTLNGTGEFDRVQNYFVSSSTSVTLTISGTITEPQLELGLAATEYIESGATTGKAGLLENSPRFDYSGGASCPSLLLEPSRTQLLNQSEYFEDSLYKKARLTTIRNATTSPEGVANAYKILTDNGQNTGYIYVNYAVTSGTTYTTSFFIKEAGRQYTQFYSKITGAFKNAVINLSTGDITNSNFATLPKAESFGDGWWRVSFTQTAGVGGDLPIYIEAGTTSTGGVLVGNGTDGVYLFGAQLEQGSYPTSYIPNHSGGSVTRELDEINELTLSDDIRGDCTIFLDTRDFSAVNSYIAFKATDGTTAYSFYSYSNHYDVYNGSAFIVDSSADATGKIALVQSGSSVKIFVNGQDKTKSGATANAIGIAKIIVSQSSVQNNMVALKQMLLFPSALSDAECITLTS